jgi:hypothetical protein
VQEVPGSNPGSPTKFLKDLEPADHPNPLVWSPTGVQIRRLQIASSLFSADFSCWWQISLGLSHPEKTRQIASKSLKSDGEPLSGNAVFPTKNPTNAMAKPDIQLGSDTSPRQDSQYQPAAVLVTNATET